MGEAEQKEEAEKWKDAQWGGPVWLDGNSWEKRETLCVPVSVPHEHLWSYESEDFFLFSYRLYLHVFPDTTGVSGILM